MHYISCIMSHIEIMCDMYFIHLEYIQTENLCFLSTTQFESESWTTSLRLRDNRSDLVFGLRATTSPVLPALLIGSRTFRLRSEYTLSS